MSVLFLYSVAGLQYTVEVFFGYLDTIEIIHSAGADTSIKGDVSS